MDAQPVISWVGVQAEALPVLSDASVGSSEEETHSLLGPGKYAPEQCRPGTGGKAGGGPPSHSGKLLHTEPRFRDVVKKDSHVTPAPGSYRPRYTLTESRHNI